MGSTSGLIDATETIPAHGAGAGLTTPAGTHRPRSTPTSPMATTAEHRSTSGGRAHRLRSGAHQRARWIVTAVAIALTALALGLAAPAVAKVTHDSGGAAHHTASRVVHAQSHTPSGGTVRSTVPSRSTERPAANASANEPTTIASYPGHDKCKKSKAGRGYPPWCTDPSAGWMSSSLHKAEQPHQHTRPVGLTGFEPATTWPQAGRSPNLTVLQ
jgi:hypothetical protein